MEFHFVSRREEAIGKMNGRKSLIKQKKKRKLRLGARTAKAGASKIKFCPKKNQLCALVFYVIAAAAATGSIKVLYGFLPPAFFSLFPFISQIAWPARGWTVVHREKILPSQEVIKF